MRWVYRLQQRIAITRTECYVIMGLAGLLALGIVARHIQGNSRPVPTEIYAEEDRLFQDASPGTAPIPDDRTRTTQDDQQAYRERMPAALEGPVNLNTASVAELERLPRVGPKLAARVVAYRQAHGPFKRVDDLLQVRGIGAKTLARLSPLLTLEPDTL